MLIVARLSKGNKFNTEATRIVFSFHLIQSHKYKSVVRVDFRIGLFRCSHSGLQNGFRNLAGGFSGISEVF